MLPPLSLSLSLFLSLPHLTGTLCSEISHCVMVMEKDGVGVGGVWVTGVSVWVRDDAPQEEMPLQLQDGEIETGWDKGGVRAGGAGEEGGAFHHYPYMCLLTHLPPPPPPHLKMQVTMSYSWHPECDIYLMLNATLNQTPMGRIDNL